MENKLELDLNNPIFVHYLNLDRYPKSTSQQMIDQYMKMVDVYSNITNWIVITDYSKVECIYNGKGTYSNSENLAFSRFLKEINKLLTNSNSFEEFKGKMRDLRISTIIDETNF